MLLLVFLVVVSACNEEPITTNHAFWISQGEISTVVEDANAGGLKAVRLLIAHYEATSGAGVLAEEWTAKGQWIGVAHQIHGCAAMRPIAAKIEFDIL